jgi:hypothetical protein
MAASDEPLGFAKHVKPLFRRRDRRSMRFALNLLSHDDIARNSDAILGRLRDGAMPCDGVWADEQIAVFPDSMKAGAPV